jgi:hypothetical protein
MHEKYSRVSLAIPKSIMEPYRAMAKARGVSVNAIVCSTLFDALPKPITAKPLTAHEEKEAKHVARKAKVQAMFRAELARGKTPEQILAACQAWREEAARWLNEVIGKYAPGDKGD